MKFINDDLLVEMLVNKILSIQGKESPMLKSLKKQLAQTDTAIENMLNAIEQGIITKSTKKRVNASKFLPQESNKERMAPAKNKYFTFHLYNYLTKSKLRKINDYNNPLPYFGKLLLSFNSFKVLSKIPLTKTRDFSVE